MNSQPLGALPRHMFQLLDTTAAHHPESVAVVFGPTQLTYAELRQRVVALAAGLTALGIHQGDRVALILPNTPTYVMAFYALMQLGAVAVNISPGSQGSELAQILNDSGAGVVISLDVFLPGLYKVLAQTPVQKLLITSVQGIEQRLPRPDGVPAPQQLAELMHPSTAVMPSVDVQPDDLAVLQYTSGSTGVPKGVMLSHRNLLASVAQTERWMTEEVPANAGVLCVIPFFHVFGMTVGLHVSIAKGYRMILLARFDALDLMPIIALLENQRPISVPAVPTIWAALVSHPQVSPESLRSIRVPSSGGAPLPAWVQDKFQALTGRRIYEAYGLSEAAGATHCSSFADAAPLGSIGRPLGGISARLVAVATGEGEVAVGEIGELAVRGESVMRGYWHNEALTARVLRAGWLFTGDLARCDAAGFYYIVDRKDDLIVTSGHNVYPSEVEAVLAKHPAVHDVVVVGIADRMRGQFVQAHVVVKEGARATSDELLQLCRENLSAHKVPRRIVFTDHVPRNPAGKTVIKDLRKTASTAD